MRNVVMHDFAELLPFWQLESLNTVKSRKLASVTSVSNRVRAETINTQAGRKFNPTLLIRKPTLNGKFNFFLFHINWLNFLEFTKLKISLISLLGNRPLPSGFFTTFNLSSWRDTRVPALSIGGVVTALFPIHYLLHWLIATVRPRNEI